MTSQPPPSPPIAGYAWAAGACTAVAVLAILVWLDAQRVLAPPRTAGPLLAASAAVCGCGAVVHLSTARMMRRIDQIGQRAQEIAPCVPTPSPWSLRRAAAGRTALADPAVAEATERRRLLEAHLLDQLAAKIEEVGEARYAEGYADGITRRQEGKRG